MYDPVALGKLIKCIGATGGTRLPGRGRTMTGLVDAVVVAASPLVDDDDVIDDDASDDDVRRGSMVLGNGSTTCPVMAP